jgi:Ca-activated chloride channel family protein
MKWWLPRKFTNHCKGHKGGYVNGNNTKEVVEYIKNALNNIQNRIWSNRNGRFSIAFQWFLGFVLFLFLDIFLWKENKLVNKLNLFNENKK